MPGSAAAVGANESRDTAAADEIKQNRFIFRFSRRKSKGSSREYSAAALRLSTLGAPVPGRNVDAAAALLCRPSALPLDATAEAPQGFSGCKWPVRGPRARA
jgi:hypothetical protein